MPANDRNVDLDALEQKARAAKELIDCQECGSRIHPAEHHCFDACQVVKLRHALDAAEAWRDAVIQDAAKWAARDFVPLHIPKNGPALVPVENYQEAVNGRHLAAGAVTALSANLKEALRRADAAESRATRAEEQRDRLAEALRDVAHYAGPPEGTEWLHMQQEARAALAEVEKP